MADETHANWRDQFEKEGAAVIRWRLDNGKIVGNMRDFTLKWLDEVEKQNEQLRDEEARKGVQASLTEARKARHVAIWALVISTLIGIGTLVAQFYPQLLQRSENAATPAIGSAPLQPMPVQSAPQSSESP
jgi:hypothetical protein